MGEAAHDVRPAVGLGALARVLATRHPSPCTGHQLGPRPGVTLETSADLLMTD